MSTVYKLTDSRLQTYQGYQWALGERRAGWSGTGPLCGPGWVHAYTHPLLAVLLNPIHANIQSPKLFEGDGVIGATDHGLKVGCSELTLLKELPIPAVTSEHRVRFGILCALAVCADPDFVAWAERWLSGADRTTASAAAARWAAAAVAAARWAASAAAAASPAAGGWAAAEAAGWAAGAAATRSPFNLIQIAEAACAEVMGTG